VVQQNCFEIIEASAVAKSKIFATIT